MTDILQFILIFRSLSKYNISYMLVNKFVGNFSLASVAKEVSKYYYTHSDYDATPLLMYTNVWYQL